MSVQPIFEDCKFCAVKTVNANTAVECKISPKSEIKTILSITGTAASISEEVVENELRYSGRALFCVIYESTDGKIEKSECGVEFSDKAENTDGIAAIKFATYDVNDVEVKNANGAFYANAVIAVELLCSVESIVNVAMGGEDIIFNKEEKLAHYVSDCARASLQTDDEFELGYSVKDIIYHDASANITDVQSGLGNVIMDGNVFITLIALQNNEKNDIVKETRSFPFRLEATLSTASPSVQAFARGRVSKNTVKVVVDDDKHTSTIIVSVDIDAYVCTVDEKTTNFVTDAYSVKNHLAVTAKKAVEDYVSSQYVFSERISGASDYEPLSGSEVVAAIGERVSNLSLNKENNLLTGIFNVNFIERQEGGSVSSVKAMMPFEIPFTFKDGVRYAFDVCIDSFNYRIRAYAEPECTLKIRVTETSLNEYTVVTDIAVGGEKEEKTDAISVYIARDNDTLWDVCKELGASAEKIMELNPDLQFPLSSTDRVIIYRNI